MASIILSSLFGILTLWIMGFVITFRKQLTSMVGMMAAMTIGMTVGFVLGTLLALWLPGQYFHSTMIGMLTGGAIGAMTGAPISLMAVLDGLLSGIMGGMMGTMLMGMMPATYTWAAVNIISVLCSGIVFILFLMLQGEIKAEILKQRSILLSKPQLMFSVISIGLIFTIVI
jgi:hypothetical protein